MCVHSNLLKLAEKRSSSHRQQLWDMLKLLGSCHGLGRSKLKSWQEMCVRYVVDFHHRLKGLNPEEIFGKASFEIASSSWKFGVMFGKP